MKKTLIWLLVIIVIGALGYWLLKKAPATEPVDQNATTTPATTTDTTAGGVMDEGSEYVIGQSVEGRDITAYHYGDGDTEVLFIGGLHGGYSWNTSLVAYELMDYLDKTSQTVPANVRVTVIPVANPDGLFKVTGKEGKFAVADVSTSQETLTAGRFNANNVDLNRNFDCEWQATGTWQNKTVSGGTAAFSEPESAALRDYVAKLSPDAVVIWYSAAGGVYSSACGAGVLAETTALTNAFAKASGYPAHESFDFYETTGDMANWLAKQNIPAISVLLTNHTDTEWSKNKAGVDAVLASFAN